MLVDDIYPIKCMKIYIIAVHQIFFFRGYSYDKMFHVIFHVSVDESQFKCKVIFARMTGFGAWYVR